MLVLLAVYSRLKVRLDAFSAAGHLCGIGARLRAHYHTHKNVRSAPSGVGLTLDTTNF